MKTLDRYLMAHQARVVSAVLGIFVVLLFMTRVLEDLDNMVEQHASIWMSIKFFTLNVPPDLPNLLPFAFLLGSVFTGHHLIRRGEVTGMLSGGMSPRRIFGGVTILAIVTSVLLTVAWDYVVVPSERASKELWSEIKKQPTTTSDSGIFHILSDGRMMHAAAFVPEEGIITGLTVLEFDPDVAVRVTRQITAAKAKRISDSGQWILENVVERSFIRSATAYTRISVDSFPEKEMTLFSAIEGHGGRVKAMRLRDIRDYIKRLHAADEEPTRYLYAFYTRLAYPWNCLGMALIGIVVAVRRRGTHVVLEIAIAMAVAMAFYSLTTLCEILGESGTFPAWLCAWFPPVLTTAVGFKLLDRAGLQ